MKKGLFLITMISLSFLFTKCKNSDVHDSNDIDPSNIFFDYMITGEEGRDDITIHLRFRAGGHNGNPILLAEPSKVELDGRLLLPDSTKFTGVYYEKQVRIDSFAGKHTISFTDRNGKKYIEEFEFIPFSLISPVPDTHTRNDLQFTFRGLQPVDVLRVLLTDTAFSSDDINEVDTVSNGRLLIPSSSLSTLVHGPVYLEFYKETERPVKQATRRGGRIMTSYGLKRHFELKGEW